MRKTLSKAKRTDVILTKRKCLAKNNRILIQKTMMVSSLKYPDKYPLKNNSNNSKSVSLNTCMNIDPESTRKVAPRKERTLLWDGCVQRLSRYF